MATGSVRDLLVRIRGDGADLEKELNKAVRNLDAVGRRAERIGRDLTLKFTAPMAAAGFVATKMAIDFDTEMTKIVTLVGVAEDQVNEWRRALLELGPTLGRSPQELARALFVITSAGERGENALRILERAGKAAAAGLGETAEIARTVTAAMQAYADSGLTAERATDVLVATVREGNLEASDLAGALGRVLGIAASVGVEFEEVGAFVATFTRLGVNAEEAVVSLRGVLSTLQKPTKEAHTALAEMGTSLEELRASVRERGLTRTLIDLVGLAEDTGTEIAAVVPNVRALAGVLGTAGVQGEAFTEIAENVADSAGILDDAFARVERTPAQTLAQFRASLEAIAITLGDSLAPSLNEVLRATLPYLRAIREINPETVKMTVKTLALLGVIGPLFLAFGSAARTAATLAQAVFFLRASAISLGAVLGPGAAIVAGLTLIAGMFAKARLDAVRAAIAVGELRAEILAMSDAARRERGIAVALGIIETEEALDRAREKLADLQSQARRTAPTADAPVGLTIPVAGTNEARAEVKALEAQLESYREQLLVINDAERRAGEQGKELRDILGGLGEGGEDAGEGVRGVADVLKDLNEELAVATELGGLSDEFDENALAVAALQAALRELVKLEGDHSEVIATVAADLRTRRAEMLESAERAKQLREEEAESQRTLNFHLAEFSRLLALTKTPQEEYAERLETLNFLLATGNISLQEYNRALVGAMEAARQAVADQGDEAEDELGAMEAFGLRTADSLADGFAALATGSSAAFRAFADSVIRDLARIAARFAVFQILTSLFPGSPFTKAFGSASGFRAAGGPVSGGRPYVVGEHGRELFVPSSSGTVIPNKALTPSSGGGELSAAVLSAIASMPRVPMTPEAYALTDWFRRVHSTATADGKDRGLR